MDAEKFPMIDLSKTVWSLCAQPHRPLNIEVPVEGANDWQWMEARLPVDILTFLKEKNIVSDPIIRQNDLLCRWVEEVDWAFQTQFEAPESLLRADEDLLLSLADVDCWATVYLNGEHVGNTQNQFREHEFQVKELLHPGLNTLIIYIRSAKRVNELLERAHGALPSGFDTPRVHARRCQCLTGWDWASRLSSVSIMSIPRLQPSPVFRLEAPFAYVRELAEVQAGDAAAEWAIVVVQVEIAAQRRAKGQITAEIVAPDGSNIARTQAAVNISAGKSVNRMSFRLRDVRLWWPLGFGERPQYTARFLLTCEDRAGINFSAESEARFAMRTATVERRKDADGECFVPRINGVRIFCRGANWIPVSMLPAAATDADYIRLLSAAAAAGMNCLRVWGGGVYERDLFYNCCDKLGILVWQDFMFACAAYPTYREFLDEVELEAGFQIRRLRNHPSLFVWCGNNENEWLHQIGELRKGEERRIIGEQIWSALLKEKVEDLDPSRAYHQSSPFGRNRDDYNDQGSGDRHNWDCWAKWQSPEVYIQDSGRFISEFGFQAMPDAASIQQFAPGANDMNAPELLHHQKMILGQERIIRYAAEMYRLPLTFHDWIETSQQMQAEILRRAVEHWRRRRFLTAGTLIWQLNDAYPALSWSLIDHYGRPKQAYFAARRFFAPVLLSCALQNDGVEVGSFSPQVESGIVECPPEMGIACGDQAAPATNRSLVLTLINDSRFDLRGRIAITTLPEVDSTIVLTQEVEAPANAHSLPWSLTLADLGIADPVTQMVRASFIPDEQSAAAIDECAAEIRSSIASIAGNGQGDLFDDAGEWPVDLSAGISAEVLLVEPKFFGAPAWHRETAPEPQPELASEQSN